MAWANENAFWMHTNIGEESNFVPTDVMHEFTFVCPSWYNATEDLYLLDNSEACKCFEN